MLFDCAQIRGKALSLNLALESNETGCFEDLNRGLNPHFMLLLCLVMRGCLNCFGRMNAALPLLQMLGERAVQERLCSKSTPEIYRLSPKFWRRFRRRRDFHQRNKESPTPAKLIAAHCCHSVVRTSVAAMSFGWYCFSGGLTF